MVPTKTKASPDATGNDGIAFPGTWVRGATGGADSPLPGGPELGFSEAVASNLKAKGFFYSELAKMVRAGFGIDRACAALRNQRGADPVAREICRAILEGLKSGKTVAEALRGSRLPVTELEVSLVDAAEKGGRLETGFRHLAEHFRQEAEARRRIRRAMVYPLFLFHFAFLVGVGITALLRQVSPEAGETVGRATVLSGLAWLGAVYALVAVLAALAKVAAAAAEGKPWVDALMRRLPLSGPVRTSRGLARFCEVLYLYLLSGQRRDLAWSAAGRASRSGSLKVFALRTAPRLGAGESVHEILGEPGVPLPGDLAGGLASADLAGALDEETARWSDHYRAAAAEHLEHFMVWVPKLFYGVVLVYGAAMAIRVALSYRDLIQSVLDWSP